MGNENVNLSMGVEGEIPPGEPPDFQIRPTGKLEKNTQIQQVSPKQKQPLKTSAPLFSSTDFPGLFRLSFYCSTSSWRLVAGVRVT